MTAYLLLFALVNGLVVGRGLKSSGAIMGVRTSEISEASSTSLDTVTSMGMNLLPSSTILSLSLSRKTRAMNNNYTDFSLFNCNLTYQCYPV